MHGAAGAVDWSGLISSSTSYIRSFIGKATTTYDQDDKYRHSKDIDDLVRRRHGNDIFIVGSTLSELRTFWKHVGYKADGIIEEPREVSKTIVDIDSKSHGNYAEQEGVVTVEGKEEKPLDWFDEFDITSKKARDDTRSKSYTVQTTSKKGFQIGGSGGLSAGPDFFNLAGGGMKAELGINASYSNEETQNSSSTHSGDTKLSQAYEIVDKLRVPPRKKVEAKITTWAVTYEAKSSLKYTVDADIALPVRYRNHLSRCFGGFYVSTTYIPAREIFRGETDYHEDANRIITFKRDGCVSYVGEEVEIKKSKKDL